MRIAVFLLALLVSNLVMIGGIALIVLTSPDRTIGLVWMPVLTLTVLVDGPLLLGTLSSYWDVRRTPATWRAFRWWFRGVRIAQAIAVLAIIAFTVLAHAPWWVPIAAVVLGAVVDVLAARIARVLLRRDEARRPADPGWQPISRARIVRKVLVVAATFAGALLLAGVAMSLLFGALRGTGDSAGSALLFALEFAFLAAAIACIVVTLELNRRLREDVSRDVVELRTIGKVVLRNKPIPLDEGQQVAAAKYAVLTSITLPFTVGYLALLYIGLGLQQVGRLQRGPDALAIGILVLFVVAFLVLLPLTLLRARRARAYAAAHAWLLPATGGEVGRTEAAQS